MATYYIGANDEHGQNPFTAGKRTPVMPYLNTPIYENQFNRPTKNKFIEACLRQGFAVFDVKPELTDIPIAERVRRINRQNLTLLVTFGYNAFGTGTSFNSANGISTFYSSKNAQAEKSKQLAEEIYEELLDGTAQRGRGVFDIDIGVLSSVNCVSSLVESGFMTNLTEAKLMLDPAYQTEVAEETCQGVCKYLGISYVERNGKYPLLRQGSRGNFVMLLQFMLYQLGYEIDIDGAFGTNTANAVREYQQVNKLTADGIVGTNTWKTLLTLAPQPVLRQGDKGSYVYYLQNKLLSKLYPLGSADGIFGAKTKQAVMEFQTENGLTVDGIVGPNTWQVLDVIGGGRS